MDPTRPHQNDKITPQVLQLLIKHTNASEESQGVVQVTLQLYRQFLSFVAIFLSLRACLR